MLDAVLSGHGESVCFSVGSGVLGAPELPDVGFSVGLLLGFSVGSSVGLSEGSGRGDAVLVLVTVNVTGSPGLALKSRCPLYKSYPSGAFVCLTQKSVPVRLLTASFAMAVPSPVVRVRRVLSPVPMLTVAPGRSLPLLSSLALSRTEAGLNGFSRTNSGGVWGVMM